MCCDCNSPTDRLYHETLLAQRLEQPHNYSPELVGSNQLFWRHLLQRYEGGKVRLGGNEMCICSGPPLVLGRRSE